MSKDAYEGIYESRFRLHETTGQLNYSLECFGDYIAKREKYKTLDGMEAIWFYLVKTYHWPLNEIRSMHPDDIRFLLSEEMHGWTLPPAAR
jgi:hypothetical protein